MFAMLVICIRIIRYRLEYGIELHGHDTFEPDTVVHVPVPKLVDIDMPVQITLVHVPHTTPPIECDHGSDAVATYQRLFAENERVFI